MTIKNVEEEFTMLQIEKEQLENKLINVIYKLNRIYDKIRADKFGAKVGNVVYSTKEKSLTNKFIIGKIISIDTYDMSDIASKPWVTCVLKKENGEFDGNIEHFYDKWEIYDE